MANRYRWVIIGVLFTAYIVVFMQRLSIGPVAPFLKQEMGLTSTQIGTLVSAASLGYGISMIPAGWLADRISLRRIFLVGEVVGGVFMIVMFTAPAYPLALIAMAISGIGCGCLMPSTTKAVIVWFPFKERATMMGIKQTGVNVAGIVTAFALPWVALTLGWRYGFLFLGLIAITIGILSFIFYKNPPAQTAAARSETGAKDVKKPAKKSVSSLFKSRDIWLVTFAGFAMGGVEFALVAHLVLYLTEALVFSAVAAGAILAITQAGGILGKPLGGLLSDRLFNSSRKVFVLWSCITTVALLVVAFLGSGLSWALYPILFIAGMAAIGWGGIYLTLTAELAGIEMAGTAVGLVGSLSMVGFVLGPIVFGYIIDATRSYPLAWLMCAVLSALCALAVFLIREEKRRL